MAYLLKQFSTVTIVYYLDHGAARCFVSPSEIHSLWNLVARDSVERSGYKRSRSSRLFIFRNPKSIASLNQASRDRFRGNSSSRNAKSNLSAEPAPERLPRRRRSRKATHRYARDLSKSSTELAARWKPKNEDMCIAWLSLAYSTEAVKNALAQEHETAANAQSDKSVSC